MKKSLLLAVLLALPVAGFSAVTANNFTVNVGGGINYATTTPNEVMEGMSKKDFTTTAFGGGFNVELGHLYLSQGSLIHAFDTRLGFGMNFNNSFTMGGEKVEMEDGMSMSFDSMSIYVGTTYAMGAKVGNGTLLVDVLGVNLGYFGSSMVNSFEFDGQKFKTTMKDGGAMLMSINLPLGTQYVFNNGLMLGFRHRLDIAFGSSSDEEGTVSGSDTDSVYTLKGSQYGFGDDQASYLAYNLTVSLGFAFGL